MKDILFKELSSSSFYSSTHLDLINLLIDSSYLIDKQEQQDARSYLYLLLSVKPLQVLILAWMIEQQDIFYSRSNYTYSLHIEAISIINATFSIYKQKVPAEFLRLILLDGEVLSKELISYGYNIKLPNKKDWYGGSFYRIMSELGIEYDSKSKIDSLDHILRKLEYEDTVVNNALLIYERFRK